MGTRRSTFPFRVQAGATPVNITDGPVFADAVTYKSTRSPGATLIDSSTLAPIARQQWKILSVSITAFLCYDTGSGTSSNFYGKLGKIRGGLVLDTTTTRSDPFPLVQPWVSPILPLPPDHSLVFDLWDPAADPIPPNINSIIGSLPGGLIIGNTLSLPTPVVIRGSELPTPSVGIWMEPMLIGRGVTGGTIGTPFQLLISGAICAIVYDDEGY